MSDNERRIIDYDAFNDLPPNSWLIVDSEGQGTGKIAPIKIGATYEIQDGAHSFTLVGSNGYTHTVDIPYDSVQMSYEDYQALTEVQKMDGTNRFVPDVPTDDLEPEIWQRVGRDPLTTDEKTVSKAINELDGRTKAVNGDAFDDTVTYSKGDYCIYDNKMYTYNVDTPSSGAWDSTKWVQTDIQTEFTNIKSNLTELLNVGTLSDGYQFAIVEVTVNDSVNGTYTNRLNVSAASNSSSYSNIADAGYEVFCLLSAYAQRDADASYQVAVPAHPFGFTSKTWVYVPVYASGNTWTTHYTLLCRKVN